MSASPVALPFHRAALVGGVARYGVADALEEFAPEVAVAELRQWLAGIEPADLDAAEQLELVAQLERLKSAAAAVQARASAVFSADKVIDALAGYRAEADLRVEEPGTSENASRRRAREEAEVAAKATRSAGSEIALARRESPVRGDRFVGMARALVDEMPATMAALEQGEVSEWGATVMVRGTAVLTREDRAEVDAKLGPQLKSMSAKGIDQATRREAAARDAAAVVRRREQAVKSRRVSVRPAPDGMAYLTLLTTMKEAVAAYATLHRRARSVTAGTAFHRDPKTGAEVQELPDGRGLGAIMADTAIARLTGRPTGVPTPVEIQLVITDRSLLGSGDPARSVNEPARIPGHGIVPAPIARDWARDDATDVWLRRLYTDPTGRDLVAMDSHRRTFTGQLRSMLVLRDDTCRTPYCDAPIVHGDHTRHHVTGGATSYTNGAGLCARCNHTKEALGWKHTVTSHITLAGDTAPPEKSKNDRDDGVRSGPRDDGEQPGSRERRPAHPPHTIRITTPTGRTHHSTAPPLLGPGWTPPDAA